MADRKTQGTDLYVMNAEDGDVLNVGCVTSIDGIDSTVDQIDTTCLREYVARSEAGLDRPGTASFGIRFDPQNEVHLQMHEWKKAGKMLAWAVGFRQNDKADLGLPGEDPTSTQDSFGDYIYDLHADRDWLVFEGYMTSYPFSFQQNSMVESNISVQISGAIDVVPAAAST